MDSPQALNWEREQAASYEFASEQATPTYAWCMYAEKTGDTKHPVSCLKDGKYATPMHCQNCDKRKDRHA